MTDTIRPGGLWVYCERGREGIRPVAFELLGQAARLARAMNSAVTAVLVGGAAEAAALGRYGADAALCVDCDCLDELAQTDELAALVTKYQPEALLIGATAFGRSLAPRLAARLNTGLTADCTGLTIDPDTGLLLQTRPAFGGNLMATIVCPDRRPQMATVRPKVFPAPLPDETRLCPVVVERPVSSGGAVELIQRIAAGSEINIGDADVLVSVGQGIGGAENIALAEALAKRLGGTLSASRPLVDAGVLPYARQVGQTGKTVSPRLYIALGISGAIQHMAGVAAQTIVAVNTDPDAPIFQYAHYAVRCDCGAFLREALEALRNGELGMGNGEL